MKTKLVDLFGYGAIAGAVVVTGALYARLPAQIPIHFDIHGNADGFAPRAIGAWVVPGMTVLVTVLLRSGVLLPARWKSSVDSLASRLVLAFTTAFLASMQGVLLYAALRPGQNMGGIIGCLLGAFWVALGFLLPRVERNPWIGIRTRWTLASDENWARTHRFAGYVMVPCGVFAVAAVAIGFPAFAIGAVLLSALASTVYSYFVARRQA